MTVRTPTRILMIEDNPGDVGLVRALLAEAGDFAIEAVGRLDEAAERLRQRSYDIMLLDLSLPDSLGLDSLRAARAAAPHLPIVVLTGTDDDELALESVRAGAQDYLVKGRGDGDLISRAIRNAIGRSRSDEALRLSEARFRAIFQGAPTGIGVTDAAGRCIEVNPALQRMLGYEYSEILGRRVGFLSHPDDLESERPLFAALIAGERDDYEIEKRYIRKDGSTVWARLTAALVRDAQARPLLCIGMVEDISERRRMEELLRLSARVIESTSEGVYVTDAEQRIVHVNPAFTALTGYTPGEVYGRRPSLMASGRHDGEFYRDMQQTLQRTGRWQGEVWNRRKSGELFAEWLNISAVRNERDEITNFVAVFSDITSRKQAEERLSYLANHDALTTLPNRTLFHERLSLALARSRRNQVPVGLLFLDLDRFKEVNDGYGHAIGDKLLQGVAERLCACTRQGDTVARLAGDEFVIILEDIGDFRDAAQVAQKIMRQFAEPFLLDGVELAVSTSIGISLFPADGADGAALMEAADAAMYQAKKQGRNVFRFHDEKLNAQASERQSLLSRLQRACEEREFRLEFQPIFDLASDTVVGAEALLRWQHPDFGLLPPARFLSLAEETGAILDIGRWGLAAACAEAMAWRASGLGELRVSVNLGPHEFRQSDLADSVAAALAASGLPPALLELDVPEACVMADEHGGEPPLHRLKTLGVRVAIDDFGTGHSSFNLLRKLPVDTVKIDQAFVHDVVADAADARLVTAIATIARSLNLSVVGKGVEAAEQLSFLRKHGCEQAQGFLLGRPMPADAFRRLLAERLPATK